MTPSPPVICALYNPPPRTCFIWVSRADRLLSLLNQIIQFHSTPDLNFRLHYRLYFFLGLFLFENGFGAVSFFLGWFDRLDVLVTFI